MARTEMDLQYCPNLKIVCIYWVYIALNYVQRQRLLEQPCQL